ncbi:MAG: hypothetical protein ACLSSW_05945 [Acutalibacteraceae bacterium]
MKKCRENIENELAYFYKVIKKYGPQACASMPELKNQKKKSRKEV